MIIQLTPLDKRDFTLETEATHTGGNLGIAGSFGYRNKNVFRGAEVFEFRIKGARSPSQLLRQPRNQATPVLQHLRDRAGSVAVFQEIPVAGFHYPWNFRYFNPRSTLTTGFNYQDRPDFRRSILNLSFGYQWRGSTTQRFSVFRSN